MGGPGSDERLEGVEGFAAAFVPLVVVVNSCVHLLPPNVRMHSHGPHIFIYVLFPLNWQPLSLQECKLHFGVHNYNCISSAVDQVQCQESLF